MRLTLRIFFAVLALAQITFAGEPIKFKKGDKLVSSIGLVDFKKLAKQETVLVWEPHENKEVSYRGYPFKEILDKVYGKDWESYDLILFTCADGYKDPIPRALFEREKAWLAFERGDKKSFSVNNRYQNQKNILLSPLYLVWNNIKNGQIRAEGAYNWPYQIIGIELNHFTSKFPHMVPPEKSSPQVHEGFQSFQKYCMTCHKINGDGGDKGPDLSQLREKIKNKDWLKKWIDNPQSISPNSNMPPLLNSLKNRNEIIENIISYLNAMQSVDK